VSLVLQYCEGARGGQGSSVRTPHSEAPAGGGTRGSYSSSPAHGPALRAHAAFDARSALPLPLHHPAGGDLFKRLTVFGQGGRLPELWVCGEVSRAHGPCQTHTCAHTAAGACPGTQRLPSERVCSQ
jgi:hypothetical protein